MEVRHVLANRIAHRLFDRPTSLAYSLAWLAALFAAVSALAGLFVSGLYRDTEGWIRQAMAADLVTLLAVVPVLAICLWSGATGRGRLIAVAALGYLAYTYAIFGFSMAINAMTPIHIAVLGLSVWSLALYVIAMSHAGQKSVVGSRLPRRATAIFLVIVSGLFGLMWLSQIALAISTGRPTDELSKLGLTSNPVYTLDLAFALPLLAIAGVQLLRRWPRGPELGLVAVGWVGLMGLGVLAIFAFDAASGAAVSIPVVVVIGVITGVATVLTALGLTREHGNDPVTLTSASAPTTV
jgi:hypothetical protein